MYTEYMYSVGPTGSDDDIGPIFARPQLCTSHSPVNLSQLPSLDSMTYVGFDFDISHSLSSLPNSQKPFGFGNWVEFWCLAQFPTLGSVVLQYIPMIGHIVDGK